MHDIVYVTSGLGSGVSFEKFVEKIRAKGRIASRILGRDTGSDDRPSEWKKLLAIMDRAVERGLDELKRNDVKCKVFSDNIGEFKVRPWRVMFFIDITREDKIVITHCFKKKRDDTPPTEIERVRTQRERYYEHFPPE